MSDLYEVLGLDKTASQADIKRAYHKLALQLHPDKNPGDEEAKEKFQKLQEIYAVLGDPEKRKLYDETGVHGDAADNLDGLKEYYKGAFRKVSEDDIKNFEKQYRGSEEEKEELLKQHERFKGNMTLVFEFVLCSRPDLDAHRFMDIIDEAIKQGILSSSKKYEKWAKQTKATPRPEDPLADRDDPSASVALIAAIRGKGESRMGNLVAGLEAKYGGKAKGKGRAKKKQEEEPPELDDEAFEALQKKMLGDAARKKPAVGRKGKKGGKEREGKLQIEDEQPVLAIEDEAEPSTSGRTGRLRKKAKEGEEEAGGTGGRARKGHAGKKGDEEEDVRLLEDGDEGKAAKSKKRKVGRKA